MLLKVSIGEEQPLVRTEIPLTAVSYDTWIFQVLAGNYYGGSSAALKVVDLTRTAGARLQVIFAQLSCSGARGGSSTV